MLLLSLTFVAASLLAWRSFACARAAVLQNIRSVAGQRSASSLSPLVFLGLLTIIALLAEHVEKAVLADVLFGMALLAAVAAIINASLVRMTRLTVNLPGLPENWRGRVAALVSDTHWATCTMCAFMREIVLKLNQLRPDIVFITGDMYDGTAGRSIAWPNRGRN